MNRFVIKKSVRAVLGAAFVLWAAGCGVWSDVDFTKSVFKGLIEGRYTARRHIDWSVFNVIESDLGQQYNALPNEKEKTGFERSFIESFRDGFKSKGATWRSFVNWRVFNDADPKVTYVAADNKDGSGTLIFSVAHNGGKKKLTGIRMVIVQDRAKYREFEKEQQHVLQTAHQPAQQP